MTDFRQQALDYHSQPTPGKISVSLTTAAETSEDLSLAYSPGVAEPCREIDTRRDVGRCSGLGATRPPPPAGSSLRIRSPFPNA